MSSEDILIKQLKDTDLKTTDTNKVNTILSRMGESIIVKQTLHPGKLITRARSHKDFSEQFNTKDLLSYRPQRFNTTFQRASTPHNTMFYGAIVPDFLTDKDFKIARLTASLEATNTFRDNINVSHEKVTYSGWEVIKPIHLAMVCYHKAFLYPGSMLTKLNEEYLEYLETLDPQLAEKSKNVNDFISGQYAKSPINDHRDYMISALFSEIAVKNGLDGVVYPSVRSNGQGLNVCLSKDSADNKIKLIAAGECRIMRNGFNPDIITESATEIANDKEPIIYTKLKTDEELEEMWQLCLKTPQKVSR